MHIVILTTYLIFISRYIDQEGKLDQMVKLYWYCDVYHCIFWIHYDTKLNNYKHAKDALMLSEFQVRRVVQYGCQTLL